MAKRGMWHESKRKQEYILATKPTVPSNNKTGSLMQHAQGKTEENNHLSAGAVCIASYNLNSL